MVQAADLTAMLITGGNRWRFADPAGSPLEAVGTLIHVDFSPAVPSLTGRRRSMRHCPMPT